MTLLDRDVAGRAIERALRRGGDLAELYVEDRRGFSVGLDDRRVERPQTGRERGAGLRVVAGDATYFGHVDGLEEQDLLRIADSVASAVGADARSPQALQQDSVTGARHAVAERPEEVDATRKADLLRACDERARAEGDEVAQVMTSYAEARRVVEVFNSEGLAASDDRTRVRLGVQVVARRNGTVETGHETRGGHAGFELVARDPEEVAASAARKALTMLDAVDAPTGRMPVVVGNGFGGVLLHEAVGHGLEADAVQKRASVYAGRLGERLAEPFVTAYDDGRRPGEWGSDGIDDEGTPTRMTPILEQGQLASFLYDLVRARKDGTGSTGNGRRESFRHLPVPRMTNTYFAPGDDSPEELIAGVDRGLYAVSFGGGQVEPATGDFVFGVSEGYLIEGGRVTTPVRGATLVGNGVEALRAIDGVAADLAIATGFCGKAGQRVAAGVGQPHVRIRALTVGGHGGVSVADGLEAVGRRAVEAALAAGAGEAEAWVERSWGTEVRVYEGEVESLTEAGGRGLGVRVFSDGRPGYAYGTDLSDAGVVDLAAEAAASAAVADPDEYAGLPEDCGAAVLDGLRSPSIGDWSAGRKLELALATERAARAREGVTQVEDTVYADSDERVAVVNSRGFAAGYEATSSWSYASAFAGAGADLMTGIGLGIGRGPDALDPEAIGGEAADRALALVGARQPAGRRCPVVLDAFVAASFVGFIGGMLSADAVQRGRSLFADREGDEIAAATLRLADDGLAPDGLASSPFDGEGSPRRRTKLIENGRLATYLFDARTARKAGRTSTGSAARSSYRTPPSVGTANLVIEPGTASLDELLGGARDGLYVTDVAGLHSGVNPISGTFSVGATGRLIEGGELAGPVREITIASDLVSMLRSVRAVGSEARWVPFGGSVMASPLLLGEMAVSGA